MEYLGIKPIRPTVGVFDFTGCEGCQLQLANKEESLGAFLSSIDIVNFREISSDRRDDYDIAFIDGAISRDDEVERLKKIRARAGVLVALGSCACFGGVNRQKNRCDPDEANREVYGDRPKETGLTRSVGEVVKVDLEVPGCPVSKVEIERIVRHVLVGLSFEFPAYPVCLDCKQGFTTCLFDLGELCLGPITRGGCEAPCPKGGLGCFGCRGVAGDCNLDGFLNIAGTRGFGEDEIRERLDFFGGFEAIQCKSTQT